MRLGGGEADHVQKRVGGERRDETTAIKNPSNDQGARQHGGESAHARWAVGGRLKGRT